MQEQHIGIFDSGIGGLTVASAIRQCMPHEKLMYFGDIAHLPYGDKSPDAIRLYSGQIAQFLLSKNCKALVIACNTASAHAYSFVQNIVEHKVPVINVIDPMAAYVSKNYKGKKIGVIGTKGTIKTRVYPNRIKALNSSIQVVSLATPLLAPMIEEGFFNNHISKTIVKAYLEKSTFKGIEALILGCTHYPLIKKEITSVFDKKVEVIDSSEIVAKAVMEILKNQKLLAQAPQNKIEDQFFVSDYTEAFEKSAKHFFRQQVNLTKISFW